MATVAHPRNPLALHVYRWLSGNCSSKEIFATDVRFLNDLEESVHIKKIAQEVIDSFPELDVNGWPIKQRTQEAVDQAFAEGPLSVQKIQVFVASFSLAKDELSQRRGYSHGTSGISLGLDLRHLRPPISSGTLVTFAPCVYDEDRKKKLVRQALERFASEVSELWRQAEDMQLIGQRMAKVKSENPTLSPVELGELLKKKIGQENNLRLHSAITNARLALFSLACFLKNSAFRDEQEWRLVLPVAPEKKSPTLSRHFRITSTTMVPYIAHPLFNYDGVLTLREVILGPGSFPNNSLVAAASFLSHLGIDLTPTASCVPFRTTQ